jgi:hypothetical protein
MPRTDLDGVRICGRGRHIVPTEHDLRIIAEFRRTLVLLDTMKAIASWPQPTAEQLLAALGIS